MDYYGPKKPGLRKMPHQDFDGTLLALERFGVSQYHVDAIRSRRDFAQLVAEFIRREVVPITPLEAEVRQLLGPNKFFGLQEWSYFFGAELASVDIESMKVPSSLLEVMRYRCPISSNQGYTRVHQSHRVFLGLERLNGVPLTTNKIRSVRERFDCVGMSGMIQTFPPFTTECCQPGYYLVYDGVIPSTVGKVLSEQRSVIPVGYRQPSLIEQVTACIHAAVMGGVFAPSKIAESVELNTLTPWNLEAWEAAILHYRDGGTPHPLPPEGGTISVHVQHSPSDIGNRELPYLNFRWHYPDEDRWANLGLTALRFFPFEK